jgi:hypothetical protein
MQNVPKNKWILLLVLGLGLLTPALPAREKTLGLGVTLGDPTGVSGKLWLDDVHALDFAVGTFGYYRGYRYGGINVHADYLWHFYNVFGRNGSDASRKLPIYFGVGGMFSTAGTPYNPNNGVTPAGPWTYNGANPPDGNSTAGVRGVIGITYIFAHPFDVFAEVAPTVIVTPDAGFGIDSSIGGRFYF